MAAQSNARRAGSDKRICEGGSADRANFCHRKGRAGQSRVGVCACRRGDDHCQWRLAPTRSGFVPANTNFEPQGVPGCDRGLTLRAKRLRRRNGRQGGHDNNKAAADSVHLLKLAFLAPKIVEAIAERGELADLKLTPHVDLPLDWTTQKRVVGLE